ncbi:reverse transcriptase-like protein [Companilactobacillus versmoldensis]|uniref:Ribonuclease H n=1 Tax=Companilactobacillus versmoldensis DSM 14857 = KCTC 3814 TaxID=1423815 RepID=A0A0R1SG61_9LACO|nr:reverse transcriptase-like protein [Companilactobacillus versmoldensis]KRL68534.1 ribonuclease H [Companilactobacillus versmoldensis DSM 14857 = KCTC 3814]
MIKLYTDAGLNTNQNLAAIAYVYSTDNDSYSFSRPEKELDNHYLEFLAVLEALKDLDQKNLTNDILQLKTDSQIVVDSIDKHYSKHYQEMVDLIMPLLEKFPMYFVKHIADKDNGAAHTLVHQELIHLRNI